MQENLKKEIRWAEYLPQHHDSLLYLFMAVEKWLMAYPLPVTTDQPKRNNRYQSTHLFGYQVIKFYYYTFKRFEIQLLNRPQDTAKCRFYEKSTPLFCY